MELAVTPLELEGSLPILEVVLPVAVVNAAIGKREDPSAVF